MSFLGDFLQAVAQQSVQKQAGIRRTKSAECTPCAANAYVSGLRDAVNGKSKSKRRKSKR